MKAIKLLSVCMFAVALLASPVSAGEEKKPCCEATVESCKKCTHECCKKAGEAGKVCKKCHPKPAKDKK